LSRIATLTFQSPPSSASAQTSVAGSVGRHVKLRGPVGTLENLQSRAASHLEHMDATVDISRFKIVKSLFPHSAGAYAGPE
jgi:hypothetical protein